MTTTTLRMVLSVIVFTAPTMAPTGISWVSLSCSSALVYWHALASVHQRGIIKGYHVNVYQNTTVALNMTETAYENTTENQFLILSDLDASSDYTLMVAAYSTAMGPYSPPVILTLNSQNSACVDTIVSTESCKLTTIITAQ